jgi:hypothetical protein
VKKNESLGGEVMVLAVNEVVVACSGCVFCVIFAVNYLAYLGVQ